MHSGVAKAYLHPALVEVVGDLLKRLFDVRYEALDLLRLLRRGLHLDVSVLDQPVVLSDICQRCHIRKSRCSWRRSGLLRCMEAKTCIRYAFGHITTVNLRGDWRRNGLR